MRMSCNSQIHDELKNMDESVCPFCNQLLIKGNKDDVPCCSEPNVGNKNGMNVCLHCGLVHGCEYVIGYLDFYENIYKILRKSIYQRKYHIETVMNNICFETRIDLTHDQRERIFRVFAEISDIIPTVNGQRKRLISTKYIICRLFELLGIQISIEISKSQKTMDFYYRYWNEILTLKSDKIIHIMK